MAVSFPVPPVMAALPEPVWTMTSSPSPPLRVAEPAPEWMTVSFPEPPAAFSIALTMSVPISSPTAVLAARLTTGPTWKLSICAAVERLMMTPLVESAATYMSRPVPPSMVSIPLLV